LPPELQPCFPVNYPQRKLHDTTQGIIVIIIIIIIIGSINKRKLVETVYTEPSMIFAERTATEAGYNVCHIES